MCPSFEYMTNLQYEAKKLRRLVEFFRPGEEYVRPEEKYCRIMESLKHENKELREELAKANEETRCVRNLWMQANEDVIKEKGKALAQMAREMKKMETAMYRALREKDAALDKLREKRQEIYEVQTQLEEEKGKNRELTARINRDYTNSSSQYTAPA